MTPFPTRAEILAHHFHRESVADPRLPPYLSSAEFPAYAREADAAALRAAGFFVLTYDRPALLELARTTGWCEHAIDAGYDPRRGVERHYSDGALVVYFHPATCGAAPSEAV